MDLVLQGWSVRQICSTVRCSHTTVQCHQHLFSAWQNGGVPQACRGRCLHQLVPGGTGW
ncbi:helix-turn-helix domain-containing protein [Corynebacterium sp. FDAARGOS 1242]|uniref:helix-turn-helix domain-containing protein n=1 Tax=Corynebacterium sp. FDAARGOS 1242 TaxID=2778078 RepID=UPI00351BFACA